MTTPITRGKARWMRLFRPRVLFVLAISLAALVMLPTWLKRLPRLDTRTDYQLAWSQLELPAGPAELPPGISSQLEQISGVKSLSLFDQRAAEKIAWTLAKHPWVARVDEVRLAYPAKGIVRVEYRQPVAMVERPRGIYPVASDGVLLPPEDFRRETIAGYPQIRGITTQPAGAPGTVWGDPVVESAARLAQMLATDWTRLGLEAIVPATSADLVSQTRSLGDLEPAQRKVEADGFRGPAVLHEETKLNEEANGRAMAPEFVILTKAGSRIEWGKAPGDDGPGELTAAQKLGRLNRYVAEVGSFGEGYAIDLRHWHEISRRPMTATRPASTRR
jgi:hypothetical protein